MKKSEFLNIIREEIKRELREAYGMEQMYFAPSGFEQMNNAPGKVLQRYDNVEKWKVIAMQLGAVIRDRGDDWIAEMPDQTKIGVFSKINQYGTLTL